MHVDHAPLMVVVIRPPVRYMQSKKVDCKQWLTINVAGFEVFEPYILGAVFVCISVHIIDIKSPQY